MTRKTQHTRTTEPINATPGDAADQPVALDGELRRFLREVCSCQSLTLAAWASRILRVRQMRMADLERCLNLAFEL